MTLREIGVKGSDEDEKIEQNSPFSQRRSAEQRREKVGGGREVRMRGGMREGFRRVIRPNYRGTKGFCQPFDCLDLMFGLGLLVLAFCRPNF